MAATCSCVKHSFFTVVTNGGYDLGYRTCRKKYFKHFIIYQNCNYWAIKEIYEEKKSAKIDAL